MLPISGEQLTLLIPQKPPFVFISSLVAVSPDACTTTFTFDATHLLCHNGFLTTAGMMENMAQSAGCKMGFEDFQQGKTHSQVFIGEIRDFVYNRLSAAGEEITTEVVIESRVFGAVAVAGVTMRCSNETIATCKMKIFFTSATGM